MLLCVLTALLLRRTVFGRHVYAVGSNEATARLCGVAVERTKILIYTLAGLLTGASATSPFTSASCLRSSAKPRTPLASE